MDIFNLPKNTVVNKAIPKNTFDAYVSTKQKKSFTDLVGKIVWRYKLAPETINLPRKEMEEIQVIHIELKRKEVIPELLKVIDKSIPYAIIFIIQYDQEVYLSVSSKHAHPVQADVSVIDWTFSSDWYAINENKYYLPLKDTLDYVFFAICKQLSRFAISDVQSLAGLIEKDQHLHQFETEVKKIKLAIANCKQFNKKVEFNLILKSVEQKIKELV